MNEGVPAIRFVGLSKRFAGITALDRVSFDVEAGACHALCGENGAGKSTLGKLLAGIHQPDSGHIELFGTRIDLASPRAARDAGVAMVHQELSCCDNLTVADNLSLGTLPQRFGFVDRSALRARAVERLTRVGVTIDPDRTMRSLSVAERQMVQIATAVSEGAQIIVFDEPTSSLGDHESAALFRLLQALRVRGVTIVYVSHRMPEIFALSDAITVLRDGRYVDTQRTAETDPSQIVQRMIGRAVEEYTPSSGAAPGVERLRVEGFTSPGSFSDITFTVRSGEVVGLAGLVGAGRSEIAQALFGLDPASEGAVFINQAPVNLRSARDAMRAGIGLVPEDRKKQGLVLSMKASENATLPILERFSSAAWINRAAESLAVRATFKRLRVRAAPEARAGELSGGNQQKLVMAKWLAADADILLLDEPTRGVDVATKAELHHWIGDRAEAGAAILLISSELPELLSVCTRILVLREGRLVGELPRAEATQDGLLRLMTGLAAAS